jgi:AraC family transcriptional regulator
MAEVRKLVDTSRVTVGFFQCPPGDVAWRSTNHIGDRTHVVFPSTPVVIRQRGRDAVLTTPNHAVLYDADQLYERELRSERGDECVFICLSEEALREVADDEDVTLLDANRRVRVTHTATDRRTYLAQHLLARRLRRRELSKREGERAAVELVRDTLRQAPPKPRARRDNTSVAHKSLAEAAKSRLAESLAEPLPLHELAHALHTSPFHLARVFRAETGFSVNGYRSALRLRVALSRLAEDTNGLTALALELGFASHSHFTDTFRREFGIVPSALRDVTGRSCAPRGCS